MLLVRSAANGRASSTGRLMSWPISDIGRPLNSTLTENRVRTWFARLWVA